MRSNIFYSSVYLDVQTRVKEFLNAQETFLSPTSLKSPRAVGDALQDVLAERFSEVMGPLAASCSTEFARRAMADVAFTDRDGIYYVVDVKTHRKDTKFNMPNLTSVERLARFYESDTNCFVILFIAYSVAGERLTVSDVHFVPIEFLDWSCLTIGALGWGQIQIANSNLIRLRPQYSRKAWMLELCEELLQFYPREIAKISERIKRFERVRELWGGKADTWSAPPIEPPTDVPA
ncbi:MAG: hypothetical protein AB2A00_24580 [Myxococcota bacterium]